MLAQYWVLPSTHDFRRRLMAQSQSNGTFAPLSARKQKGGEVRCCLESFQHDVERVDVFLGQIVIEAPINLAKQTIVEQRL